MHDGKILVLDRLVRVPRLTSCVVLRGLEHLGEIDLGGASDEHAREELWPRVDMEDVLGVLMQGELHRLIGATKGEVISLEHLLCSLARWPTELGQEEDLEHEDAEGGLARGKSAVEAELIDAIGRVQVNLFEGGHRAEDP